MTVLSIVRYLSDGNIEYLDRLDNQVKIRGFRIELGEIEAVLAQHPLVRKTVVICTEDPNNKRLIAYVVPEQKAPTQIRDISFQKSNVEQLLQWTDLVPQLCHKLQEQLPEYMVPSLFVMLEAIPLTPNGKIDRHALPTQEMALRTQESNFVAPGTSTPDLILLDIQMPEMNGYEVCQKLKADEKTREIPVIFISALTEVFDKVKAFSVGGVDYVTKPFQAEEVLARVETHLKLHQLQQQLKAENLRMHAELEVTRCLQQLILPTKQELEKITGLEIVGFMEPAEQVSGDYYDVLPYNGHIMFGIGDVTGHGLESGMLMIMVQMAVRTLLKSHISDPSTLLTFINKALYENVNRMNCEKTLTLFLADYYQGVLTISGQHEEVLVVRKGHVERIDTIDLGFPLGLEEDVGKFVAESKVSLAPGDVVILYTDGVTEAENTEGQRYEIDRLCEIAGQNW